MTRSSINNTHPVLTSGTLDVIENLTISENVIIHRNSNTNNTGEINNCDIQTITFSSGTWKDLIIRESNLGELNIQNSRTASEFLISNCTIQKLIVSHSAQYNQINLNNCEIKEIEFRNDCINPISIAKCRITSALFQMLLPVNQILHSLQISESKITSLSVLTDTSTLEIKNRSQIQNVEINSQNLQQLIVLDSTIHQNLQNLGERSLRLASFKRTIVEGDLVLKSKSGRIEAETLTVEKELKVLFLLNDTLPTQGKNSITIKTNSQINRIEISAKNPYNHNHVNIQDTQIHQFVICESSSNLFLKNIYVTGQMHFKNTTLSDEAVLDRMHLNKCIVKLTNSSITQAKFHSVRWRRDYTIDESTTNQDPDSKITQLWDIREGYRQLKVVSLSSENKIDAKQFLKQEVRIYYKALTQSLKANFSLGEFGDWLVLWTNSTFSDFGESWLRPLLFLFGFHCLFFLYLMYDPAVSIGVELGLKGASWDAFKRGLGLYLNLLSPIHDTEVSNVYNAKVKTSIFGTLDFCMRLSSAYFIYYFVKATRKFNFNI